MKSSESAICVTHFASKKTTSVFVFRLTTLSAGFDSRTRKRKLAYMLYFFQFTFDEETTKTKPYTTRQQNKIKRRSTGALFFTGSI